jgi:DNA-binding transcriptional MerR regulator
MLQTKTHFAQVSIEIVRRILDDQNRQEEAGKHRKEGRKRLFEEDLLQTKEKSLARSRTLFSGG